jgi:type I restriction enzyme S subunit
MTWPSVALGEICLPKQHPTISSSDLTDDGYPAYGANGQIGFYSTYTHDRTTIAITCRGATCGTVNIVPAYSYISGNAMALDNLDERQVDLYFLAHALQSRGLTDVISGSAQPQITRGPLVGVQVPLPPLPEQRRIAAILDQADALRAKRRAALAQLDEMTQAIFMEMFGDLHLNQNGWHQGVLGSAVRVAGGYAFKSEDFADDGLPVIRISNLSGGTLDTSRVARIPAHKIGKGIAFKVLPGDILIAMSGATTGKIGIVPPDFNQEAYQNQRVGNFKIRDRTRITSSYLTAILKSQFYQEFLWNLAAGAAQPNVSGSQLESAVVPFPPMALQAEFSRKVEEAETIRAVQCESSLMLDALFASLQHRAFNGEL